MLAVVLSKFISQHFFLLLFIFRFYKMTKQSTIPPHAWVAAMTDMQQQTCKTELPQLIFS